MFHSVAQEERISAEEKILRSGKVNDENLCQYGNLSCVRCCLPHIGGDSHREDAPGEGRGPAAGRLEGALADPWADRRGGPAAGVPGAAGPAAPGGYLGPGRIVMRFKNFNPRMDPRIEASQYEDAFPDVGRAEMERRFRARRELFLALYDRTQPRRSLPLYMQEIQRREGYRYRFQASSGPLSSFLGGTAPKRCQSGELPECQLLGFLDEAGRVGCLAHPWAETSGGHDGRPQAGFFHHTDCCDTVGCEASKEFKHLSRSARKVFARAVSGLSWYEYSRHATSVLVYYLRGFDHLLERLDERGALDPLTLPQLAAFTNALYDGWPFRKPEGPAVADPGSLRDAASGRMSSLEILATDIPLAERVLYIALDTGFLPARFAQEVQQARDHLAWAVSALAGR